MPLDALAPGDEDGVIAAILAAGAAREPLLVEGRGTKRGMLRPVQAARSLSTRNLTGVTLHAPQELIVSARAGTPLPDWRPSWPRAAKVSSPSRRTCRAC